MGRGFNFGKYLKERACTCTCYHKQNFNRAYKDRVVSYGCKGIVVVAVTNLTNPQGLPPAPSCNQINPPY